MLKIKLFAVFAFLILTAIVLSSSRPFAVSANGDVLREIAEYKTWHRINKEPITADSILASDGKTLIIEGQKVANFTLDGGGGWSFIIDGDVPFSREERNKDLVGIFSDLGRQIKKIFPKKRKKQPETKVDALESLKSFSAEAHKFSFGIVYANDLAKAEFEKEKPDFAVGAIIVREKNAAAASETPETVIAMVKRENGFSPQTGDWEFFVFNGADLKIQKRETKGDCAACHSRAENTGWVFRTYLK